MPQRDQRRPGAEGVPGAAPGTDPAAPATEPTDPAGSGRPAAATVPADVVLVDHHDSYTWNLAHLVAAVTGRLPRVVQHDEVTAADVLRHEFVVLSPGPGHPADPRDFSVGADVLRAGSRPVLGVCLGMQGMVTTFGGSVRRRTPAHGEVARIEHDGRGLYAGLPQGFAAVRYHSLQGVELPDSLLATAWCDGEASDGGASDGGARDGEATIGQGGHGEAGDGQENAAVEPGGNRDHAGAGRALMGVRHVTLPIEGVQFHPESILSERGADLVRNFLLGQDAGRAR